MYKNEFNIGDNVLIPAKEMAISKYERYPNSGTYFQGVVVYIKDKFCGVKITAREKKYEYIECFYPDTLIKVSGVQDVNEAS